MAYWLTGKNATGTANICSYIMDDDSDLSDLPTSSSEGLNQNDGVSHKKADKGSKAFSISSSKNYILNSSDEWTEIN